jgi:hypothetical protein
LSLQKGLFFVTADNEGKSKAVAAFEDAILFEGIGATAGGTDATMAVIDVDEHGIAGGKVGGMHGRKYISAGKAASRKLERIVADDFEATATIIVKGDATHISAQAMFLGHDVGHIKLINILAIAANQG